jgi:hypothetical protein
MPACPGVSHITEREHACTFWKQPGCCRTCTSPHPHLLIWIWSTCTVQTHRSWCQLHTTQPWQHSTACSAPLLLLLLHVLSL